MNSTVSAIETTDSEKIRKDADKIGSMIRNERYSATATVEKALTYVAEHIEYHKRESLNAEETDYLNGIVRHSHKAMKYESKAQQALNMGKVLLIGGITAIPATFIMAQINYENKKESLSSKQKELETRQSHGKVETPIYGRDSLGDVVVSQGNTRQMLAQTTQEVTNLQKQGSTISKQEICGGIAIGLFVSQLAIMAVNRAWHKTAKNIGEKFASKKTPLPNKHVAIPNFE